MSDAVRVRAAGASDVAPVARLEMELFGVDAWSAATVAEELAGDRIAMVAEREVPGAAAHDVAGYAVASVGADPADLHRVAVDPRWRRAGVGTALLSAVRDAARDAGATRMLLEVSAANDEACAFYAAEGWTEVDRRPRYYRDGSDALVLGLALTREPA